MNSIYLITVLSLLSFMFIVGCWQERYNQNTAIGSGLCYKLFSGSHESAELF
jgi:hypothetical protein